VILSKGSVNVNPDNRAASGTLISGLVLASIGLVLLLDRFGIVDSHIFFRLWLMIFVVVGVGKLADSRGMQQRAWGGFLISIGALLTLSEFGYIHFNFGQIWPVFLIVAGLLLAWQATEASRGGTVVLPFGKRSAGNENPSLRAYCIFGGTERHMNIRDFRGGEIVALFGGFKIDLSQADIEGNEAVIDVNVMFGGGEIIVPVNWIVSVEGIGIFGGFVGKAKHYPVDQTRPAKRLVVRGAAVFGGVEVKN
jgi:predicted membrane protein